MKKEELEKKVGESTMDRWKEWEAEKGESRQRKTARV